MNPTRRARVPTRVGASRVGAGSAVWLAVAAQAIALTVTSAAYGYTSDELYFRMLGPALAYVDQPPLTPWLARTLSALVADEPWALRIPATLASAGTVLLAAAIARELGGDRRAQAYAAWGIAGGALPLMLGHVLLTSTLDLTAWLGVTLCVLRALRPSPSPSSSSVPVSSPRSTSSSSSRWWAAAGALAGAATWNRLLVPILVAGIAAGLALLGPPGALRGRAPWLAALLCGIIAAPMIGYQALHGWPQLAMVRGLSERYGDANRAFLPIALVAMIGFALFPVVVLGIRECLRRPRARWILVPFTLVVVFTVAFAPQVHYPAGAMATMYAVGCLPLSRWVERRRTGSTARRRMVPILIGVNTAMAAPVALPIIPVQLLGRSPVPELSILVRDQLGWPTYVAQIAAAWSAGGFPAGSPNAVVVTRYYSEAGAVARFGPTLGLPPAYSGHNALGEQPLPPESAVAMVFVGDLPAEVEDQFVSCRVVGRLDNELGVWTEQQDEPIRVCHGRRSPWTHIWVGLRHDD